MANPVKNVPIMLKKIRTLLAYLSCAVVLCSAMAFGLFARHTSLVLLLLSVVLCLVMLWYWAFTIRRCRYNKLSVGSMFMGDAYFDIIIILVFIVGYADDKQEEFWWPALVMAFACCSFDFVRHLFDLAVGRRNMPEVVDAATKSWERMKAAESYRIIQRNSMAFTVRHGLSCFFSLLLANIFLYHSLQFDIFNVYFMVGLATIAVECSGTRLLVDGTIVEVTNPYRIFKVNRFDVHEVTGVEIRDVLVGRRVTFRYGYGKKAVCYPSDIPELVAYLKVHHVMVEEQPSRHPAFYRFLKFRDNERHH